jgi:hypothetical protein
MASLNQIIRERKSVVQGLKKALRLIDTQVELSERLISRILSRRLKVPELADLGKLAGYASSLNQALRVYVALVGRGFPI